MTYTSSIASRAAHLVAMGGLVLLSSSCFIDGTTAVPGRVTVRWSISGTADPNACIQARATTLRISVYYVDGGLAGEYVQACTSFATTIDLYPARYSATVKLEDPAGMPRTTTATLAPFNVFRDTSMPLDVNFPRESFY